MNVFDLFAKISLDTKGYENDLGEAKSAFTKFGDGLKTAAVKIGDVLAGIGKTATVGIGAASKAVTALTKQSLDAVADFEQLKGGVDTLFGDAAKKVMNYANEAYAEAGLSANEYMEQTIAFSASLIQGLEGDTDKAADIANTAITDMADNVNKMGTTMEAVQNTYRGLARQNFMMLDNLAIGYQGTADEMARLINDSKVMGDTFVATADNVKEISFDKYIEAIHTIQTEMGITGTTHEEAARTITGSIASMEAAWKNFLTGTGSPAQFTKVMKDVVSNVKTNLNEIIPRLTEGLTELTDMIAPEIPAIIEELLPSIIKGASSLLTGLSSRLPQLLTAVLPALSQGVVDVSVALVKVMPQLVSSFEQSIPILAKTIMSKKDELLNAGKELIKSIFPTKTGFQEIVQKGDEIIHSLIDGLLSPDAINAFMIAAPQILENLVDGIKTALLGSEQDGEGGIFGAAKRIVERIGDFFADEKNRQTFWNAAYKVLKSLAIGLKDILQGGVAPLMVEVTKAWAEAFIGKIDYDDTAIEILKRLGEAFVRNMATGGIIGDLLEEVFVDTDPTLQNNQRYNNSTYTGFLDDYNALPEYEKRKYDPDYVAPAAPTYSGAPRNLAEYYEQKYRTPNFETAAALPTTYGDNNVSITINTTSNEPEEIGYAVSNAVDESLAKLQAQKNRGYGYAN